MEDLDRHLAAAEAAIAADDWRAGADALEAFDALAHGAGATAEPSDYQRERYRVAHLRIDAMGPRRISITYEIVTPESAEDGDVAERGWVNFAGVPMEGEDGPDPDDDYSASDAAIAFLRDEGATEASSSHFHAGIWYMQADGWVDYRTGANTRRSYHFDGPWTIEDEREIARAMGVRGC